ncbi:DUF2793 domain-containing protein [Croceicoccus bisphenolivorans]|uniref:DUF2793 domain-containing protein n=1 Tax=Croceicoccus bisphenolivorans TaxID=1783232 RepID=UPI0008302327|nr:DUF2793 domain-containing protein [Croceicoccus bisphenolivorans]
MIDPISFNSSTPRFGLPLLFAAQAQKEFYVNEAHVLSDMLMHPFVEGVASEPPVTISNGQCWIISNGATGAFAGQDGHLAFWNDGQWIFAQPTERMAVFDRSIGKYRYFEDGWQTSIEVSAPVQGDVVDEEARIAIAGILTVLQTAGILAPV